MNKISEERIQGTVQIVCRDFSSSGSGFFVSPTGHIATNNHVVARVNLSNGTIQYDYSKDVIVKTNDNHPFRAAIVSNTNADQPIISDYAILKIEHSPSCWYDQKPFDEVSVGEEVVAIGYPHDFKIPVVTDGIVSQKTKYPSHINSLHLLKTIITNARISHGNSGGPLISVDDGRVIGICTLNHELKDEVFQRLYQYIELPGIQLDTVRMDILQSMIRYTNIGLFHIISSDHVGADPAWSF